MLEAPAVYAEELVKGKSPEEATAALEKLRREMAEYKEKAEAEDFRDDKQPSRHTVLWWYRECICEVRSRLERAGIPCPYTEEEKRAAAFEERLRTLTGFSFTYDGGLPAHYALTAHFEGEAVQVEKVGFPFDAPAASFRSALERRDVLDLLQDAHIGEWKREYRRGGEGKWQLTLRYADGQTDVYVGENAYPFGFEELRNVLLALCAPREGRE